MLVHTILELQTCKLIPSPFGFRVFSVYTIWAPEAQKRWTFLSFVSFAPSRRREFLCAERDAGPSRSQKASGFDEASHREC